MAGAPGTGACCSPTAEGTRPPPSQGLKVLLEPQVATHNLQGLTPLLEGWFLPIPQSVWVQPGLARLRGHQGGVVPSPSTSPIPQSPARRNKRRTVMGSAIAWPPPGITPARAETQYSHGKEQGCSRGLQFSLPRGHTCSVPTAKSTPCHLLFLTITVQLWSASQAKVYLCALSRWAKHVFMLASYSSCINKWAKSYSSSQTKQTGRDSSGSLTWDITADSQPPSPRLVWGFFWWWWFLFYFGVLVVGLVCWFIYSFKSCAPKKPQHSLWDFNLQTLESKPTCHRT